MGKHSKPPSKPPNHRIKVLKRKIPIIIEKLSASKSDEYSELLERCKHWLDFETKAHWPILEAGGEAKEEIARLKMRGNTIVMEYNLGPGFDKGQV